MVEIVADQKTEINQPILCPRMLIVDDEQDICAILKDFFTIRGFNVISVFSGEEALERITQEPIIDVLLLDILLPGLSGIEVLRRVRELKPDLRIVMITSLDDPSLRQQASYYGAAGYVTKPFDLTDKTWAVPLEGLL